MDKWDGQVFIDELRLSSVKTVLEIGVGTGRLALAKKNLKGFEYTELIAPSFLRITSRQPLM
jgi:ubiquinone/menaquinone biosynthesis C-methylase UbiE